MKKATQGKTSEQAWGDKKHGHPYMIVCGSMVPTYCGIGKYAGRLVNILQEKKRDVIYITHKEQSEHNEKGQVLTNIRRHDIDLKKGGLFGLYRFARKYNPKIVNIQYQTFGKNYKDAFFGLSIHLARPKTKVIATIHEYEIYSRRGRFRLNIAMRFANKVLFSDYAQRKIAINDLGKWLEKKSEVVFIGPTVEKHLGEFKQLKRFHQPINIGFHGLIQPDKGLHFLVEALKRFDYPYTLHILGTFKPVLDYRNKTEITQYQNNLQKEINRNKVAEKVVIVHGDIEPGTSNFRAILSEIDVMIFPFVNYLTARRSSFMNTAVNSNCLLASTFQPGFSDDYLNPVIKFEPNFESILNLLNDLVSLSNKDIEDISRAQNELRQYLIDDNRKEEIYCCII